MKKKLVFGIVAMALLVVAGCISSVSPETGQTVSQLDPNVALVLDRIAEALDIANVGGVALSPFWPIAGLLAGIAGGLAAMWRKLKPQVTEAKEEAALYYNVTAEVVTAIEQFKKAYPGNWLKLEIELEKLIGPQAEAVIRALRRLPRKM